MIDFIIYSNKTAPSFLKGWVKISISKNRDLAIKENKFNTYKLLNQKLIIIGDCINTEIIDQNSELKINFILNKLKGNFYAILLNENEIKVTSSAFGLLPVYYKKDFELIASSVEFIKRISNVSLTENKKWVINQLLFNYQFSEDTFYNEIKLFPTFSYLTISESKTGFIRYFSVANVLDEKPTKWKKSVSKLSDLFIDTAQKYIPDEGSVISFTGGFDGRTLVSVATHFNSSFETFSYGKIENDDVYIPLRNSKKLDLPYHWLKLDENYSGNGYSRSSTEYIKNTCGANGLLYAHVDYSAKWLKSKSDYLISGVCGSELFRAAHSSGAVTSKALIDLFKYDSLDDYRNLIFESEVFKYIEINEYKNEIEEVVLESWKYKMSLPNFLSKNQKLYVFVYEEIFRKFFGAWVTAQMKYIKVRTPYIDFDFFKAIIGTELSGAYSDFLTENPLKRFKGQVLYADIIKRTNKDIYNMKTGKGYAPNIIREPILRPLLLLSFIKKRIRKKIKKANLDNLGIVSGVKYNYDSLINKDDCLQFKEKSLLEDLKNLNPFTNEAKRDVILMTVSLLIFINEIND